MAESTTVLNQATTIGDAIAVFLDSANKKYQEIIVKTQTGGADPVGVTAANPFPVSPGTGITFPVVGNVGSGFADVGNGIKVAGIYNSATQTFTTGNRADLQTDVNGFLKVNIAAGAAAGGTSSTFGAAAPAVGTAIGFTDGTNMQLGHVDGSGNLKVNIAAGGVPAGQDNSAFTAGATQGLPAMAVFNDGVGALTSGNQGALRSTADRKLFVAVGSSVSGGWSQFFYVAAATPAAQSVKGSAGQVGYLQCTNSSASWAYLKVFNATSVTLGTTVATQSYGIPPGGGFTLPAPIALGTGIQIAVTAGISATDNTGGLTANAVSVNVGFA